MNTFFKIDEDASNSKITITLIALLYIPAIGFEWLFPCMGVGVIWFIGVLFGWLFGIYTLHTWHRKDAKLNDKVGVKK